MESNVVLAVKSDHREVGVWFDNHEYDYKQNWTTLGPVTN